MQLFSSSNRAWVWGYNYSTSKSLAVILYVHTSVTVLCLPWNPDYPWQRLESLVRYCQAPQHSYLSSLPILGQPSVEYTAQTLLAVLVLVNFTRTQLDYTYTYMCFTPAGRPRPAGTAMYARASCVVSACAGTPSCEKCLPFTQSVL